MTPGRTALTPQLSEALISGSIIVTPNNRLARHLAALHGRQRHAAGDVVWSAPIIVPWHAWLERLWFDVMASGCRPDPPRRIASGQATWLWLRIVAAEGLPLLEERGAAKLAAQAWALVHAWGAGGPSWRSWAGGDDDSAVFARWAEAYGSAVADVNGLDDAQLSDWLAHCAPKIPAWRTVDVALAGFVEFSPQQERLLAALSESGARIARLPTVLEAAGDAVADAMRCSVASPRDEVVAALSWAQEFALANPGATIGIAIEDLESRRTEIRALADEVLCPSLQWPGREEDARPYNLSLGTVLGEIPLIAAALDVIALAHAPLPLARAAILLRSPHVAGATDDWLVRAPLEAEWLQEGRSEIPLATVVAGVGARDAAFAPLHGFVSATPWPSMAAPRAWADIWRACLDVVGWPGGRALSSVEWQVLGAWDELLAEFAALGNVAPRLRRGEAVTSLGALARGKIFQAETIPTSIQILGVLEATGLPLDALWVAGLAAETWPPSPRPNPLLPLAWQRERDVPRSTAARELAYARALTGQWARSAPQVVFSCAATADGSPRAMSSLVAVASPRFPGPPQRTTAGAQFDGAPVLERVLDDHAPPHAEGTMVPGGAGLIAAQSDCPFQAMARHRLEAHAWPSPVDGFSARERGTLVHAALAAFWRDVIDHAALIALSLDDLSRRVDAAAAAALGGLPAARWGRLPPVVAAGEATRIGRTVRTWLDDFDRIRPPYAVAAVEASRPLKLGGLQWELRVDRIDTIAEGCSVIIDYKTGDIASPVKWFTDRPQEPQLGLYWLAQQDFDPARPVRAVAFAQLKPGEMKAVGLAEDAALWPRLREPPALGFGLVDWPAAAARWRQTLDAIATEIRTGFSAVAPRDRKETCRRCGRRSLCRIGASMGDDNEEAGDE